MCVIRKAKVIEIIGNKAKIEDGRTVLLGDLKEVKKGDKLEVFANLAVAKINHK